MFYLWYSKTRKRYAIISDTLEILAIMTALSISLVGLLNRNIQPDHKSVAALTFITAGLFLVLMSRYLYKAGKLKGTVQTVIVALPIILYYLCLAVSSIIWDEPFQSDVVKGLAVRPDVWLVSVLE